jgi:hypothetical protein
MVWFIITLIFSTLLDIVCIGRLSDQEKDLEIMILRHQLNILVRKQKKPIKPSQAEKFTLAVLVNKLRQTTNRPSNQLKTVIRDQMLASDFFTVEAIWLKTLYVFFFIELGTRRIHLAGITTHPNSEWVAQQARHFVWQLEGNETSFRFLLRDRDSKYGITFDHIFESEGMHVILTPLRAPNANAYAERWVRTVREECLDHILILNERHLQRVSLELINYYETARPHQGLDQQTPIPRPIATETGQIQRRKVLGGIINDYHRTQLAISHIS